MHIACCDSDTPSLQELFRNVASVIGEFLQHRLVQPDIHLRRIAHFMSWTPQFSRQFFLAIRLLSRLKSFIRSTIEVFQFSFSLCAAASPSLPFQLCHHIDPLDTHRSCG